MNFPLIPLVFATFVLFSLGSTARAEHQNASPAGRGQPASSLANARQYTVICEASEHRNDGFIPNLPTVRIRATIYLTPYSGQGHLCNEAINSPAVQPKFRVTSSVQVSVRRANSDQYLTMATQPRSGSSGGDCDLKPVPGHPQVSEGSLNIGEKPLLCKGAGCRGQYGVVDNSRPDREWNTVGLNLPYSFDARGGMVLGDWARYVYLNYIPTGGDHHPSTIGYRLNRCTFVAP